MRCSRSSASGRGHESDAAAIKEVLKTLLDNGGKVVDVLHGGPGEQGARTAADELGIQDKFFWTTPLSVSSPTLGPVLPAPPKADPAAVKAAIEAKLAKFKVPKIDLVMVRRQRRRPDAPRRPEGDEEGGARPVHRRA